MPPRSPSASALNLVCALAATFLTLLARAAAATLAVQDAALAPGLVAEHRSTAKSPATAPASLWRLEAKPAFTFRPAAVGQPESLHPALPPGPWESIWTGVLEIREGSPIRWGAFVCGDVSVRVDDLEVLRGNGAALDSWVQGSEPVALAIGFRRFQVKYTRSAPATVARLQLWWEGDGFAREPLPPWRLKHLVSEVPASLRARAIIEQGREFASLMGCAQCHQGSFPGIESLPPGPALSDLGRRVSREWLARWLSNPAGVRPGARMPALFAATVEGRAEARLVADYLAGATGGGVPPTPAVPDHRPGRNSFLGLGCVACHLVPDIEPGKQAAPVERSPLHSLRDRFNVDQLAGFLNDPASRYPDGRMPRLVPNPSTAREVAAYLLTFAGDVPAGAGVAGESASTGAVSDSHVDAVVRRLGAANALDAGRRLLAEKGCARCHQGLGESVPASIPVRRAVDGCLTDAAGPRFPMGPEVREAIAAYLLRAPLENASSPHFERERRFERAGCARCHGRDTDGASPLEVTARDLWTSHIARLPYQRTPPLTHALSKYRAGHVMESVRDGVSGLRPGWYSYRMPVYGAAAADLLQALAQADGDVTDSLAVAEPDAGADLVAPGHALVGFEGYGCVACHLWKGRSLAEADPSAVGPELSSVTRRVHRDWFDRWLEDPARSHPGTPMPSFFPRGAPAGLREILGGDVARQKSAIWSYLANSATAPSPAPRPSEPVPLPEPGQGPLVAQIPIEVPGRGTVEAIALLSGDHDLVVADVQDGLVHEVFTGAAVLRNPAGNRSFAAVGTLAGRNTNAGPVLVVAQGREVATNNLFREYRRGPKGAQWSLLYRFPTASIEATISVQLPMPDGARELVVGYNVRGLPAGATLELPILSAEGRWDSTQGVSSILGGALSFRSDGAGTWTWQLPEKRSPELVTASRTDGALLAGRDLSTNGLARPGYRAVRFDMPPTATGEDAIMPMALAVHPRTDRLFIASLKRGDLLTLEEPAGGPPSAARFRNYANGLFQDALAMQHDGSALHVLHRRNLTRIRDMDGDGMADRFERLATFPHAVANAYDWGYGLVREAGGSFLVSLAPHANQRLSGSGGVLRLRPGADGSQSEEVAWGFRNPLGWCAGPDGEVFFTDNQGEWTATSKLGHLVSGSFNGYPNAAQLQHTNRPFTPATVWVPYDWARSINGMAWENTGGKFGPFTNQIFLAELMNGGALVRANVERVNGVYQGACFPFWGTGLVGPLSLAFDTRGRLYVGSITMPGWMGQPDRGALFRIEFTGEMPFEMQTIQIRPRGFRVRFTRPANPAPARGVEGWRVESYRYEYTAAYGSPELDRRNHQVRAVEVMEDGLVADVTLDSVEKGRVYAIQPIGVRSTRGEPPLHPAGVYTVNEVP